MQLNTNGKEISVISSSYETPYFVNNLPIYHVQLNTFNSIDFTKIGFRLKKPCLN